MEETFQWMVKLLDGPIAGITKTIIYCRSLKDCGEIYSLFDSPCVSMYHSKTPEKIKKKVLESFLVERMANAVLSLQQVLLGWASTSKMLGKPTLWVFHPIWKAMFKSAGLSSELDQEVIEAISSKCQYIFSINYITDNFPVFTKEVAEEILTIVDEIFNDIDEGEFLNAMDDSFINGMLFLDVEEQASGSDSEAELGSNDLNMSQVPWYSGTRSLLEDQQTIPFEPVGIFWGQKTKHRGLHTETSQGVLIGSFQSVDKCEEFPHPHQSVSIALFHRIFSITK
ncbi:hypothetical protein OS493_013370 [Desmophyllum pertusum]|uniref:Uncharacterized protein n=1 Tax=Desmophyllum pertusum TaxID=174260 RepID=A0A9X0CEY9_9CNID|nr:hypothetical protein OS493_013370 [Desmophyllum pertusum]